MIQDLRFYLSLFLRRFHYFLLATMAGAALGLTLATVLPPNYVARARMVVESEQIPGALAESTVQTKSLEQLQLIKQRIMSREKLLDMANRLNIYSATDRDPAAPLRPDEIVLDLRERVQMDIEGGQRGANNNQVTLVQVSFSAANAELAAAVTNEVVTMILDENVKMRTGVSGQTLEFFDQEVQRLDKELADKRARILTFQEENKDALPSSLEFRRQQFTAAQSRVLQLESEEQVLTARRDSVRALFEATNRASAQEDMTPEARELARLKERAAAWTGGTSVTNARVRVLNERIAALEVIVKQQEAEAAIAAGEVGPDGKPLTPADVQIAEIENQIKLLSAERERLNTEIDGLRKSIDATPANAVALEALQRDFDNVRVQYDSAVAKRASAETGDLIEALSKGERISVLEQAIPPERPTSPNRPKLIAAGVGGGMLVGFAIVAMLELLTNAIRRPADIVGRLDIVPLATLSYIRTSREVRRRRNVLVGLAVILLLALPAGLWVVNERVMPLDLLWDKVIDKLPLPRLALVPAGTAVAPIL